MRLVLFVPHFPPDVAPTGEVAGRWVEQLAARGHEIEVITSLPWYLGHAVEEEWRGRPWRTERTDWGRIVRVHPFPAADKSSIPRRALSFVGFTAACTLAGLRPRRVDGVIAMSPPLTIGATGWITARLRRGAYVFNVQDVYPDVLVDTGAMTEGRMVRLLSALEGWVYRRADAVTVLSEDLRANLAPRADDPEKVRVIPNFVDLERIAPGERENAYRREFGLEGRTVVTYAGNIGFSQPLELLVEAADALVDRPDVVIVVNGGGSGLDRLKALAGDRENLRFVPLQPRERLPEVLAAADVHVVALRRGLARASVPSKLYSILAAARPVLASVDPGTEVATVVEAAGAGVAVPAEDPEAFVAGLRPLLDDPEAARAAGVRGRDFVEGWLSPAGVAEAYEGLVAELRSS
ncbi:MAG: glycosyltransferase family 4 protein [Actinomycetota bacterium]